MPLPRPVLLAALLALAGCGGGGGPQFPPDCSRTAILADAADLSRYRSETTAAHDVIDQLLAGRITGITGSCARGEHNTLDETIQVSLEINRGPAARDRTAEFAYFIAVSRGEQILDKQDYTLQVEFPPNVDQLHLRGEKVHLVLPTPSGVTGPAYTVLTGFQLTPAELALNRQRQNAPR